MTRQWSSHEQTHTAHNKAPTQKSSDEARDAMGARHGHCLCAHQVSMPSNSTKENTKSTCIISPGLPRAMKKKKKTKYVLNIENAVLSLSPYQNNHRKHRSRFPLAVPSQVYQSSSCDQISKHRWHQIHHVITQDPNVVSPKKPNHKRVSIVAVPLHK